MFLSAKMITKSTSASLSLLQLHGFYTSITLDLKQLNNTFCILESNF